MIWRCLLRLALLAIAIVIHPVTLSINIFSWSSLAAQNYSNNQQNSDDHMTNNISKLLQDKKSYTRIKYDRNDFEKEHRATKNGSRQQNVTHSEKLNKLWSYHSTTEDSKQIQNLIYFPNKNSRNTIKFIINHSATPKLYHVNNFDGKNIIAYRPINSQTKKFFLQEWSSDTRNLKKPSYQNRGMSLIKKPLQKIMNCNFPDDDKHKSLVNDTLITDRTGNISSSIIGFRKNYNSTKSNFIQSTPISLTNFTNASNNAVNSSLDNNTIIVNEFMRRLPYYANLSMPSYPRIIDFGYLINSSLTLHPYDQWPQTVINAPLYMNVLYNTKPTNIVAALPPECFTTNTTTCSAVTTLSTITTINFTVQDQNKSQCFINGRNCSEEKAFFRRVHHHPEDDEFLLNNNFKMTKYQTRETDTPGTKMDVFQRENQTSNEELAALFAKTKSARPVITTSEPSVSTVNFSSTMITTTEHTEISVRDDESSKESVRPYTECKTINRQVTTDECTMTQAEIYSPHYEVENKKIKSNQTGEPEFDETVTEVDTSQSLVTSSLPVRFDASSLSIKTNLNEAGKPETIETVTEIHTSPSLVNSSLPVRLDIPSISTEAITVGSTPIRPIPVYVIAMPRLPFITSTTNASSDSKINNTLTNSTKDYMITPSNILNSTKVQLLLNSTNMIKPSNMLNSTQDYPITPSNMLNSTKVQLLLNSTNMIKPSNMLNSTQDYTSTPSNMLFRTALISNDTTKFENTNSTSEEIESYTDFNDYPFDYSFDFLKNNQVNKILNLTQFNESIESLFLNPDVTENHLLKSNYNDSSDKCNNCLENLTVIKTIIDNDLVNDVTLKTNKPLHTPNNNTSSSLLKYQNKNKYKSGWELNLNGFVSPKSNYNETVKEIDNKTRLSDLQISPIIGKSTKYQNLNRVILLNSSNVSTITECITLKNLQVGLDIRKNIVNALKENKNELSNDKYIIIKSDNKDEINPLIKSEIDGIQDQNNSTLFQQDNFNEEKEILNKSWTNKLFDNNNNNSNNIPGIKFTQLKEFLNYNFTTHSSSNGNIHNPEQDDYLFKLYNTPLLEIQNNNFDKYNSIENITNFKKGMDIEKITSSMYEIITSTESLIENDTSNSYKSINAITENKVYPNVAYLSLSLLNETRKLFTDSNEKNNYKETRDNERITTEIFIKSYNPTITLLVQEITTEPCNLFNKNNFSIKKNEFNFFSEPNLNSTRKESLTDTYEFTNNYSKNVIRSTESNCCNFYTTLNVGNGKKKSSIDNPNLQNSDKTEDNANVKISWSKMDLQVKKIKNNDVNYLKTTNIPEKKYKTFKQNLNFNKEIQQDQRKVTSENIKYFKKTTTFQDTNTFLNYILTTMPVIGSVNKQMKNNIDDLNRTVSEQTYQINVYAKRKFVNSFENVTNSHRYTSKNTLDSKFINKLIALSKNNVYFENDSTGFYFKSDKFYPTISDQFVNNLLNQLVKSIEKNKSVSFEDTRLSNNTMKKLLDIELPVKRTEET